MSVVVPAFNEQDRLPGMLEETVAFLEQEYGSSSLLAKDPKPDDKGPTKRGGKANGSNQPLKGWEIIVVSDGSTDATIQTALEFAKSHALQANPTPAPGPRTPHPDHATHIPPSSIRAVQLEQNRGKGGAVTHGMRHVRGKYAIFADADGASKIEDLSKMVVKAHDLEAKDPLGRAVAVGSRAHLVGSEAVVKVRLDQVYFLTSKKTNNLIAFCSPQLFNALLPSFHSTPDAGWDVSHCRHPMRIQAIHPICPTIHNTLHAHRRMDIRRGDAHARRGIQYPNGRGACGMERSRGKQAQCHLG
jgi:glycosyltransferase involved in cell wall biosynthesis